MDSTHQGVQPGPGPDGQPRLIWSVQAGGATTTPIVGDGTLFFGSEDGFLYALDARTGADRWRLDFGSATGVPVFGNGIVGVVDKSGVLHGVSVATGAEIWHTEPTLNARLTLADGIVYVTGTNNRAHGFDLQTGAERWSWTTTADLGDGLAIAAGTAYIESAGGVVHAVALAGSQELWSYQMEIPADMAPPTVAGDVVLVSTLQDGGEPVGELYAIDRTSGELVWRFRGPSGLQVSSGAVRDGIVYGGTQADGIYALHVADGTPVWQASGPTVFFPAALVGDTLYLTSDTPPQITAFQASDGSPLWALPTTETPTGHPVVSGGMLFGANTTGEMRAYGTTAVGAGLTPTTRPLASPSTAPTAVNPFEVIASYDALALGLDRPLAIAIGPNGDAYVTDSSNRVSQIAPDGTVVLRWGTEGSGEGEFDFFGANPQDGARSSIAVGPDGKVYVSDSANHRVQVFTAAGEFVRQLGTFGNEDGQFVLPADLSADTEGNVYVIDDPLMRISKFGPNGEFLWTADGSTDEELDGNLHGADIDAQGRIVLGNDGNRRVVYLDPGGTVVDAYTAGECDVSVDPDGNVYCASFVAAEVLVYSPSHELIGSWSGPDMILKAGSAPSCGPNGEIFALDQGGGVVELEVSLP